MTALQSASRRGLPSLSRSANRLTRLLATLAIVTIAIAARPAMAQDGPTRPGAETPAYAPSPRFILQYAPEVTSSYSGPVYIVLSKGGPPRLVPRPFGRDPIIRVDVDQWLPGMPLVVDASNATCGPMDLDKIPVSNYFAQAFLPIEPSAVRPGDTGNYGSTVVPMRESALGTTPVEFKIDTIMRDRPRPTSERILGLQVESERLRTDAGAPVTVDLTIVLPPGYFIETERQYPTRYYFGSYGFDHRVSAGSLRPLERFEGGNDVITILPQVHMATGHPLGVDSVTSGPFASMFVNELIAKVESTVRADPGSRFLSGHGAGGYTALAMLIEHPEVFRGAFAMSPWSVTLTDWFGLDLTTIENMYYDERLIDRWLGILANGRPIETSRRTWRREDIVATGGPFRSMETAFSPADANGDPIPLFDRETGAIDRSVVEHWKKFDLVERVRSMSDEKRALLATRHVDIVVGRLDTFQVEPATDALAAALEAREIPNRYVVEPESNHAMIGRIEIQMRIVRAIADIHAGRPPSESASRFEEQPPRGGGGGGRGGARGG